MTMTEAFVRNEIFIDFESMIVYGSDEVYINYPCQFPKVGFQLVTTDGLSRIADFLWKEAGYSLMHTMGAYTDEPRDQEGWYDFYIGLNGFAESYLDNSIDVYVVNGSTGDYEETFAMDLTNEDQKQIFKRLDEQCWEHLGKGCKDLLEEAHERMVEERYFDSQHLDMFSFLEGIRAYRNGEETM